MKDLKSNELINKGLQIIETNGIDTEQLIPIFKEVRSFAIEENDPLLTRSIRLVYEHLENNDGFDAALKMTPDLEEGEEAESTEEMMEPKEGLMYLVQLWLKSDNKYNRDEIRDFTNQLQVLA